MGGVSKCQPHETEVQSHEGRLDHTVSSFRAILSPSFIDRPPPSEWLNFEFQVNKFSRCLRTWQWTFWGYPIVANIAALIFLY